jgi:hypothetical protein
MLPRQFVVATSSRARVSTVRLQVVQPALDSSTQLRRDHDLLSATTSSTAPAIESKADYADDEACVIANHLRARGDHKRKLNDEQLLMEGVTMS